MYAINHDNVREITKYEFNIATNFCTEIHTVCSKRRIGPSVLRAPAEQLRWPLFSVINLFLILLLSCCYLVVVLVLATVVKIP